ncbi:unnamed protein product, partial [Symbiodinium pilosum]
KRRVQSVQGTLPTGLPRISEDVRGKGRKKGALSVHDVSDDLIPMLLGPDGIGSSTSQGNRIQRS